MFSVPCRDRFGLTLVQVLVLLSVLAILAALVLTSLPNGHREMRRHIHCTNGLRQLSKLIFVYTTAYEGYLPAFWHERWVGELGLVGRAWANRPHDPWRDASGNYPPAVHNNVSSPRPRSGVPVRSGAPFLVCKRNSKTNGARASKPKRIASS